MNARDICRGAGTIAPLEPPHLAGSSEAALAVALTGAAVFGAVLYVGSLRIAAIDATLEMHLMHGEVLSAARLAGRGGAFQVHARLDNGREVDVFSALPWPPYRGEEVEIRAAQHASGRTTYNIVKLLN